MLGEVTRAPSSERELLGAVSVYRCEGCKNDTIGGVSSDPFIQALAANHVIQWAGRKVSFEIGGRAYSLDAPGAHRFLFRNGSVEIVKLIDEEYSSARSIHDAKRFKPCTRRIAPLSQSTTD